MKVVYTAPNRAHHYKYADALNKAGCLYAFISGFPRISPRAKAAELVGKLHRADILQIIYIAGLKFGLPVKITRWLALMSKIEQDHACRKFVKDCDIFLFYNGSGLGSSRLGREKRVINIVEAVNSHVQYQEEILQQEYKNINLEWKPFSKKEKIRRIKEYEEADYILLPSEFVKRSFIAKGFSEKKLLKVPYGFNKPVYSKNRNNKYCSDSDFTVLYVGSISIRKGIRYLIEAFHKLQHPRKKLVIVGPNVHDGALNGISLTANIIFTDVLKGEQLDYTYKSADVFCLPSIEEGLALVLGEALSYSLPIIATCNTGADDIITAGIEGYIVPIRESEAICEKLQILADDYNLLQKMTSNSFIKSNNLNGWEETGKNLVNTLYGVYNELIIK